MGSIVFLQLPFLLGIGAVAMPLALHLLHRQKRRRIPFSAWQFLLQTDKRSARKHRLVDLLVLLLRMLLLLLLALALARPVVRPPGVASDEFGPLALGIVIDDSMSMQRVDSAGVSLFDQAREAAGRVLEAVPSGGEAFVLLSSGRTPSAVATPVSRPRSLAPMLGDMRCSEGGRPIASAVNDAAEILASSPLRRKSMIVITDLQKRALEGTSSIDAKQLSDSINNIYLIELDGGADNLGVREASVSPRAGFPGSPFRIEATVHNSRPEPVEASVSLWLDGQKIQGRKLNLGAASSGRIAFEQVANEPGRHRASIRLEPDALSVDNRGYAAFRVLEPVSALIIAPTRPGAGRTDEAIFLRTALNPLRTPNYSGEPPVKVSETDYSGVINDRLWKYDAVFLLDSGEAPDHLRQGLDAYVRGGGRLFRFPALGMLEQLKAGLPDGAQYAGLALKGGEVNGSSPLGLGEIDKNHPAFSLISRSAPGLFSTVTFRAFLGVDENQLRSTDRVLARYTNGRPFLFERRLDSGLVLNFTSGCRPDWGDLPLRPLFLPFLFETLKYLEGSQEARVRGGTVDEGFQLDLAPSDIDRQVRVRMPSGGERQMTISARENALDFHDANEPGFYGVTVITDKSSTTEIAVNIDPRESDLQRADVELIARSFPEELLAARESDPGKIAQRLAYAAEGYPLSGWLLALALPALLGEVWLSNIFLRAEEERPSWLTRLKERFG